MKVKHLIRILSDCLQYAEKNGVDNPDLYLWQPEYDEDAYVENVFQRNITCEVQINLSNYESDELLDGNYDVHRTA